jgi:1,4-alpha-glucan branching enzyme
MKAAVVLIRRSKIRSKTMLKKKYFKTNNECEVTFEFDNDAAESVALVSDFNGWEPVEMLKRKKDGVFYAKVRLPKDSRNQYRFLVNGQEWANDPAADAYVPNEHGGQNCIVDTTAA